MGRFLLIPLALVVLVLGPFLVWGDVLVSLSTADPAAGAFGGSDVHAGLVGIGLMVADLALPVPTTSVIAGLGMIYGPVGGAAYALAGSLAAAMVGYFIGRFLGRPFAERWIGDRLVAGEALFAGYGGWIVAASRWTPVLPEVVSVVAGVSRMPPRTFLLAVLCGALPHCAVFAVIGHLGSDAPAWTLATSALVPFLLWMLLDRLGLVPSLRRQT